MLQSSFIKHLSNRLPQSYFRGIISVNEKLHHASSAFVKFDFRGILVDLIKNELYQYPVDYVRNLKV